MADEKKKDVAKTWASMCHIAAFAGYIGIPFGNILGPLVVWLIKKDEYELLDEQGKEAINFQISITLYAIVSAILIVVIVGIFLLIALFIIDIVYPIVAAVQTSGGKKFHYPFSIKFIR